MTQLELIIVDDASSQDQESLQMIFEIAKEDPRVSIYKNNVNMGCYVSKNIGIMHAKGIYVTFQDADDYSLCRRIEIQYNSILIQGNYLQSSDLHLKG